MRAVIYLAVGLAAIPLLADDAAVIVDSGSTNTPGFRIAVDRSGKVAYTETRRRSVDQPDSRATSPAKSKAPTVPKELVKRFYADLEAARPLAELPRQSCMKSASFGTVLTIELAGETTPDLSCGDHGDPRLKALIHDTSEIEKLFNSR